MHKDKNSWETFSKKEMFLESVTSSIWSITIGYQMTVFDFQENCGNFRNICVSSE